MMNKLNYDCAQQSRSEEFAYGPLLAGRPLIKRSKDIIRNSTREQGRALEVLGHAIEYVEDQGIYFRGGFFSLPENEALKIMSAASKAVFNECQLVIPLRVRLSTWLSDQLDKVHHPRATTR